MSGVILDRQSTVAQSALEGEMTRVLSVIAALAVCAPAAAHHGFGRFNPGEDIEVEGTLTGLDFVNPHSYVYFDTVGDDGDTLKMRCEMRAATVLRRSGWSPDMFVPGVSIKITGNPHRDDPASCYAETLALGDTELLRYQQLSETTQTVSENRPLRLASGELNITGDWAQEQYLIPPSGGGLIPKSMIPAFEAGEITMADVPGSGWGAARVTFTDAGQAQSEAIRAIPPSENLRARCEITSILFDWVFDGPINRITQRGDTITFEYGRDLVRTVYMNMDSHPSNIEPSRAGHSIGRWEGDTLVVDTVGFEPGILAGNVGHTDQLHVVERFTLDTDSMTLQRDYVAEDPANFTDQYAGTDFVKPADAPFAVDACNDLTYVDYSREAGE
jgi:hypothetical protein